MMTPERIIGAGVAVLILAVAWMLFALWLERRTRWDSHADNWLEEGGIRPRW